MTWVFVFTLNIFSFYSLLTRTIQGLGKTIQSIATILSNRSTTPRSARATLVVAPTSLVLQWQQEITERVAPKTLKILLYYGAGRIQDVKKLNTYDVVLTSYGTLVSEWPKEDKKKKKKKKQSMPVPIVPDGTGDESDEYDDDVVVTRQRAGPVFRNRWHR